MERLEPIAIHQGDDVRITYTIVDSNGDTVDITEATFSASLKKMPKGTAIATFTVTATGNEGEVLISLTDSTTADVDPGVYEWDLSMTLGDWTGIVCGGMLAIAPPISQ